MNESPVQMSVLTPLDSDYIWKEENILVIATYDRMNTQEQTPPFPAQGGCTVVIPLLMIWRHLYSQQHSLTL